MLVRLVARVYCWCTRLHCRYLASLEVAKVDETRRRVSLIFDFDVLSRLCSRTDHTNDPMRKQMDQHASARGRERTVNTFRRARTVSSAYECP